MKQNNELHHPLLDKYRLNTKDFFPDEYEYYLSERKKIIIYPWDNEEQSLKQLVNSWEELKVEIENGFHERKRDVIQTKMVEACILYVKLLFWSNKKPVSLINLNDKLKHLIIKPINIVERLTFILENPFLFPSFLQLSELFIEQQKAYYRNKIMSNKKE